MGGKALTNTPTRRYQREEFDKISIELIDILKDTFTLVAMPLFYRKKESFGDADILIGTPYMTADFRKYIEITFEPNEIFHNGNCWSFDYKELQVDLITCNKEDFESCLNYFSYNDLGNLIGRLAHARGFRFGQEGLWIEHYFKGTNLGKIKLTQDFEHILRFLDLSYERYKQGFDTLEDIFEYISKSKYFNWKSYQLDELNKVNRDRNKKRASYMSFLEWVDKHVADDDHLYEFSKDVDLSEIEREFPFAYVQREIRRLEYLECKKLYIQSKLNGALIKEWTGLEGKELGNIIVDFKAYIVKHFSFYDEFIINTPVEDIKSEFEMYSELKYLNEL